MFRSLIHFEFIFVYGVRKCFSFILLQVVDQFSQHHLLNRLFFPLYIRASFVKDKVSIGAWIYLWAFYFVPLIMEHDHVPWKHRNIRKVRNLCLNPNRDCLFFSYSYIHFLNHSERLLRWELSGKLEHHPSRDKPGQTMVRVGIRIYNPRSQARSPGMVESSRQVPMQWLMAKEWITKSSVSAGRLTPEHWFTSHLPIAGVEWDFPLCWDWSL